MKMEFNIGVMLALVLLLVGASPVELTLDVPIYVSAELSQRTLDRALVEVDDIFAPGRIHLRFERAPADPGRHPVVTVVVLPRPSQFIVHGCSRGRHDHRLGNTHFNARRITLWSEQVARAVEGDWDDRDPPDVDDIVLARALGRVLAHELGHLLLHLDGHRENGLMRPTFSYRSLRERRRRKFRFSEDDMAKIRHAIENTLAGSAP